MIRGLGFAVLFLMLIMTFFFLFFHKPKNQTPNNVFVYEPKWSAHTKVLKKIADNEHALGLLPHIDEWVKQVCPACNRGNILFPSGYYGKPPNMSLDGPKEEWWNRRSEWSSIVSTPNEQRSLQKQSARGLRYRSYKR